MKDVLVQCADYPDMNGYVTSCVNWLRVLVEMAPDSCLPLKHDKDLCLDQAANGADSEPLSPNSSSLRQKVRIGSDIIPTTEVLTKYETNMKSKLADVQSIRKKLEKMLQKECASFEFSVWFSN